MLQGPPEPVWSVTDYEVPGSEGSVAVRIYRPSAAAVLPLAVYVHGGGWATGGLEEADGPCRTLANVWGHVVASVDYRLSPETPYPGALEDVTAVVRWLDQRRNSIGVDTGRLVLVGESAGGTLALGACLKQAAEPDWPVTRLVLFYPPLRYRTRSPSSGPAPPSTLSEDDMAWFWSMYLDPDLAQRDPVVAPLAAPDLTTLPPTVLVTAEADILSDEGRAFATRMCAAGVPMTHIELPGMVHGFLGMLGALPSTRAVLETIRPT